MIHTKRWNDPRAPDDGYRLLVTRYRPRGVVRAGEPWDVWCPELAPSKELLAAFHGKEAPPISWDEYRTRYLHEMTSRTFFLRGFAERVRRGETLTLLCSSACTDPTRCHRFLLKTLLETIDRPEAKPTVLRRTRKPAEP